MKYIINFISSTSIFGRPSDEENLGYVSLLNYLFSISSFYTRNNTVMMG